MTDPSGGLDPIERLNRDLTRASATLGRQEARYLVDQYYATQDYRKAGANQERALTGSHEPHEVITWYATQMERMEHQLQKALGTWAADKPAGAWAQSIVGIGPVISAGLLAHIDIERSPTVGHIWSFAGLNPNVKWLGKIGSAKLMDSLETMDLETDEYAMTDAEIQEYEAILALDTLVQLTTRQLVAISRLTNRKFGNLLRLARNDKGQVTHASMTAALAKRPWNADLKVLCWKIGESFVKVSNNDNDIYGKVYQARKGLEVIRNEDGVFSDQATRILSERKFGRDTDAYAWYSGSLSVKASQEILVADPSKRAQLIKRFIGEPGSGVPMLPPAHIHARSKRYAVKLFLSHFHHVLYESTYDRPPPLPYILENPAMDPTGAPHATFIGPPNWPMKS